MKNIFFFATTDDIRPVLQRFEAHVPLKFVQSGKRMSPNRPIYLETSAIPQIGIANQATGSACTTYMVSHRDTKNVMYTFRGDRGDQCWLLSNGDNEETVLLTLAGVWKTGTLLSGKMNTLHSTQTAQQLMNRFLRSLQSEKFTKIDVWWLGREALEMLKAGKRLSTTAEQSPPEFDLKLPQAMIE